MIRHIFFAAILSLTPLVSHAATINPDKAVRVTNFQGVTPRVDLNRTGLGAFQRHALFFDLTSISGNVTSATLRFSEGLGTQVSIGTSRTYSVYDVTTDLDSVTRTLSSPTAAPYFADLNNGTLYGSATFAVQPTNSANPLPSPGFEVDLSGGLFDINQALGSRIGFGGVSPQSFSLFAGAADLSKIELELTLEPSVVPLPATLPLMLLGVVGMGMVSRRRI